MVESGKLKRKVIVLTAELDRLLRSCPAWVRTLGYALFKGLALLILWRLKSGINII